MPTFSMAQPLSAAVPRVFEFLADPRNMPQWNSGVAEVDDRPIVPGEGARYRYRFPGRRRFQQLTCSAYHAPFLLGFRGERMWTPLGTQTVAYTFRVHSVACGSKLVMTVDVTLHGAMLLLLPVVTLGWRRDLPIDLAQLRDTLDPQPTTSETAAEPARTGPDTLESRRAAHPEPVRPEPAQALPSPVGRVRWRHAVPGPIRRRYVEPGAG